MTMNKWILGCALVFGGALQSANALMMCVYDPMGTGGDAYSFAKDYTLKMGSYGYPNVSLKAYTNEAIMAEDLKFGRCDGAAMTSLRARNFNKFTGSIDSIGAIRDYKTLDTTLKLFASPKFAKYMKSGKFEVIGQIPLGAAYVMVNDRKINSLDKAAGKRIAAMDFDKTQARIIEQIGGQPVSVDLTSMGGKFNNKQVDIIVGPAVIFGPLELQKGMTDAQGNVVGAIFDYPLIQVTASIVVDTSKGKFDNAAANQKIRTYINNNLSRVYKLIDQEEEAIDDKFWEKVPPTDKPSYQKLMREARIQMTKEGFYDPVTMKILKKVRCKYDPSNFECALNDE